MVSASSRSHPAHPRADLQHQPRLGLCLGPARPARRRARLLTPTSTVAQRLNNAWLGLCGGAVTRSAAQGHTDTTAAGKPPDNASRGHPIRVPRARAGARPMGVCGDETRARLLGHRLALAPPRRLSRSAGRRADAAGAARCHPALPGPGRALQLEGSGFSPVLSIPQGIRHLNLHQHGQRDHPTLPRRSFALSMACVPSCPFKELAPISSSFPGRKELRAFQPHPSAFPSQKQAQLLCSQLRAASNSPVPGFTAKSLHTFISLGISSSMQTLGTSSSPFAFPRVAEASCPFWLCATSAGSQGHPGHQTAPSTEHSKGSVPAWSAPKAMGLYQHSKKRVGRMEK